MKYNGDSIVNAFAAKTHLSRLLNETEQGRSITITRRGKPVARLVPAHKSAAVESKTVLEAFRTIRKKAGKPLKVKQLINEGRKY
jgi:prevent-host-death family protein